MVMRLFDNANSYNKEPAEAEEMFKSIATTTFTGMIPFLKLL